MESKKVLFAGICVVVIASVVLFLYKQKSEQSLLDQNRQTITDESTLPTLTLKDETADWETYTDVQYNFTFQYPQDWEVVNQSTNFQGKPHIAALVVSPINSRLVPNKDIQYYLFISVSTEGKKRIESSSGFIDRTPPRADQVKIQYDHSGGPTYLNINQVVAKNSREYRQSQKIFESFVINY